MTEYLNAPLSISSVVASVTVSSWIISWFIYCTVRAGVFWFSKLCDPFAPLWPLLQSLLRLLFVFPNDRADIAQKNLLFVASNSCYFITIIPSTTPNIFFIKNASLSNITLYRLFRGTTTKGSTYTTVVEKQSSKKQDVQTVNSGQTCVCNSSSSSSSSPQSKKDQYKRNLTTSVDTRFFFWF